MMEQQMTHVWGLPAERVFEDWANNPHTYLKAWDVPTTKSLHDVITKWLDNPKEHGWIFSGVVGNGKTSLAVAIARELWTNKWNIHFVTGHALQAKITTIAASRNSYKYGEEYQVFLDTYTHLKDDDWSRPKLLIIDDFGDLNMQDQHFTALMMELYSAKANLIITTNQAPTDWVSMDARVFSRLAEQLTILPFTGTDYRKHKPAEGAVVVPITAG